MSDHITNLITAHRWVKDLGFLSFESVALEDGEVVKIGLPLLQELLTEAGWEEVLSDPKGDHKS